MGASDEFEYLDFELSIRGEGSRYYAKVTESPAGQSEEVSLESLIFGPNSDPKAAENLRIRLENALLRSVAPVRGYDTPAEAALRQFGSMVFDGVFQQGTPIAQQYRSSLTAIQFARPPKGLRLKLRISAPELSQLPWEYLYDSHDDEWVGLQRRSPIIRFVEAQRPSTELTVEGNLNILCMIANPRGTWKKLDTEKERRRIDEALGTLKGVNLRWVPGETATDLAEAMRHETWHVFHFIGHGGVYSNEQDEEVEGFVVMADENGAGVHVPGSELKTYLQGRDGRLPRLVVLNCCESAAESTDAAGSPATSLLRAGVPSVVAMQFPITDRTAATFAAAFYAMVARNEPIESALTHARITIRSQSRVEWGIPVLYTRSRSGRLFAGGARTVPAIPPVDAADKFGKWSGPLPVAPQATQATEETLNARRMLRQLFSTRMPDQD